MTNGYGKYYHNALYFSDGQKPEPGYSRNLAYTKHDWQNNNQNNISNNSNNNNSDIISYQFIIRETLLKQHLRDLSETHSQTLCEEFYHILIKNI